LLTAEVASRLSKLYFPEGMGSVDVAYRNGIFDNFGVRILSDLFPVEMEIVLRTANQRGLPVDHVLGMKFGVSYKSAAKLLFETWGISQMILPADTHPSTYDISASATIYDESITQSREVVRYLIANHDACASKDFNKLNNQHKLIAVSLLENFKLISSLAEMTLPRK